MSLMIDGHNLIPHIQGLTLSDLDDEQRLIEMVQEYCRIRRKQAEIYFDNAPIGIAGMKKIGMVSVKFARQGRSADLDIKERLASLGKAARNWIVVTSDKSVQLAARVARAKILPADEFAMELWQTLHTQIPGQSEIDEACMSEDEVSQWEKLFRQGKQE